jgi:hypothetical protein
MATTTSSVYEHTVPAPDATTDAGALATLTEHHG